MDVRIFLTPTMGFLIAEVVDTESTQPNDDFWFVKNPRYLQAYVVPDPADQTGQASKLSIHLNPVIYKELLKDGVTFQTKINKADYTDVSDSFNDHAFDMYIGVEGAIVDAEGDVDKEDPEDAGEDNIVLASFDSNTD